MATNPILANPVLKAALQAQMDAQNVPPPPTIPGPSAAAKILPSAGTPDDRQSAARPAAATQQATAAPATFPGPSAAMQRMPTVGAQAPDQGPALPPLKSPRVSYGDRTPLSPEAPPELLPPIRSPFRSEHARLLDQGSGISQIAGKIEHAMPNHPTLGKIVGTGLQALATAGDVGLSAVAPEVAINLPGTAYHHQALVNQSGREDAEAADNAEKAAQTAESQQRTASGAAEAPARLQLLGAQAAEEQARADALKNSKAWKVETSPGGEVLGVTNGVTSYISGQQGIPPEAQALLDQAGKNHQEQVNQTTRPLSKADADLRNRMWNPILAKHHLPQNPFSAGMPSADAAQVYSSLNGVLNQGRGDTNVTLREEGLANQQGKQDTAGRQAIYKTYQPVMDSAERYNVMTQNAEDALENHDQQAMLSLLANHLGMTMGLQKGARITRDTYQEAQQSQPWLQGIKAKFDKDGYLAGVTLSPQQIQQMVGLARDRYREDVVKARNEGKYLGATDDGPERTPSQATINYYVHLAGGDPKKAKQLAADDGWSVQ